LLSIRGALGLRTIVAAQERTHAVGEATGRDVGRASDVVLVPRDELVVLRGDKVRLDVLGIDLRDMPPIALPLSACQ
jgi:hypothetical protein